MEAILILLVPFYHLVDFLLELYIWVIFISVILGWLVMFGVLNYHNKFISVVGDLLFQVIEPALGPIRRKLPSLGGVDLSPFVLILAIVFVREALFRLMVYITP